MIALLVAMTSSFSWLKRPTPGVKTGGFFILGSFSAFFLFGLFSHTFIVVMYAVAVGAEHNALLDFFHSPLKRSVLEQLVN